MLLDGVEEAGVPEENPHMRREITQTSHRKNPWDSNQRILTVSNPILKVLLVILNDTSRGNNPVNIQVWTKSMKNPNCCVKEAFKL